MNDASRLDTSDGKKVKITDTNTNKGNYPQKLLTNRKIPDIIQDVIPPVNQTTAGGVATSGRALRVLRAVLHKEIFEGAMRIAAGVIKYSPVVNWKDMGGTIPVDINIVGIRPKTTA